MMAATSPRPILVPPGEKVEKSLSRATRVSWPGADTSKPHYSTTHRKSLVDFLNLVRGADARNPERNQYACQKALEADYGSGYVEKGLNGEIRKATMTEASGLVGGYLLPLDYSDQLLETVGEESFIYQRANVIPMYSKEMSAPRVDVETAPASGVAPFFGGVNFKWGNEQAATETEPKFRMTSFTAWDLLGYCLVSNQWLQDAGAIQPTAESPRPEADPLLKAEHYLMKLFGRAAAWQAEYAFLQGLGSAQQMPLGILRSPAAITVNRITAGQISSTAGPPPTNDISNMTGHLLPRSWGSAIWACSPSVLPSLQALSGYFINIELEGMFKMHPKPCGVLSTLPLFITEKLPAVGNRGDLVLFDPALYIVAQRAEVVVDVSPDDGFATNQTTYRIWLRLDGKPEFSNSITLPDTTTTVSPYIILQ